MSELVSGFNNLIRPEEISKVYHEKRKQYVYESIPKKRVDEYLAEGWEVDNVKYKTVTRMKKPKPIGDYFEDQIWCILSKMNFKEMNRDRNFKIPISSHPEVHPKQIDVFAKDDDVVLLVECKAASKPTKVSLRKDINEINGIRANIITSINSHYGKKLRVGWIFATKNIIWINSDVELAKSLDITIVEDEELDIFDVENISDITIIADEEFEYYQELVNHIGPAAKYQLFADIFKNRKIPGLEVTIPAIKGKIGNLSYYSFSIEPIKLLPIAFISHRSKADAETVITYQRMLNKNRLLSIRNFIKETGGLFPNSIIINFHTGRKPLVFDSGGLKRDTEAGFGYLHLPNRFKSAWIIDGQHRLYGFSDSEKADSVTIPVIAFENLDASTQAKMFVDINSKQKRVPRNLLEDLYSDLLHDFRLIRN